MSWKKFTNFLNHPIVQLIGGGGVIGLLTWLITFLEKVPGWLIWLGVLFAIGCVFWILNQIWTWRERHKKGFSTQTSEIIEATLRKWLDKRHYASQHQTDNVNLFGFVATDEQNRPINILRPKDNPDLIRLILAIDEKGLEVIPPDQQSFLRFGIGVEMARFGLLCNPNPPMYIHLDLPCDDFLTENTFLNAIDKIRQAHILIVANIQVALIRIQLLKNIPVPKAQNTEGSPI